MTWSDLLNFVQARDRSYLGTVKGVNRQDIELCEENSGIALPRLYVDFLATMGESCGAFWPFGVHQNCNFYRLVEMLPAEDYPGTKFFKVAFEDDPSAIAYYDMFLDLGRSDGEDAGLVRFEDSSAFSLEHVIEVGFTLHEWFNGRFFNYFEVRRRAQADGLYRHCDSPAEIRRSMETAVQLLSKMGLKPVLPPLPRVSCLQNKKLSALVEIRETVSGISIDLGADDIIPLKTAIEQIMDGLPGFKASGNTHGR